MSRIDYAEFARAAPAVVEAMAALGRAVDESGLEKSLTELVKLRVSQINGCAFCVQFHLNVARGCGVDGMKLDLVATWRDAQIFSRRERAGLGWAEVLTGMDREHVFDADYEALQETFSRSEIAFLSAAVASINAWNRIAGGLAFTPPPAVA